MVLTYTTLRDVNRPEAATELQAFLYRVLT
jgi:hypothetical protein